MFDVFNVYSTIAESGSAIDGAIEMVSELAGRFGVDWRLLVAQIVNFCVVAYVLYRFAFKPILKTLSDREKRISEGLQYAEEMEQKLKDAEREHAVTLRKAAVEAKGIVDDARNQARQFIDDQTKSAAIKADDILKKAQVTIEHEHRQMLGEARKEIANLVLTTTSKVLKRDLSPEDRSTFTKTAAKELALN